MKSLAKLINHTSEEEYLESCRQWNPSQNWPRQQPDQKILSHPLCPPSLRRLGARGHSENPLLPSVPTNFYHQNTQIRTVTHRQAFNQRFVACCSPSPSYDGTDHFAPNSIFSSASAPPAPCPDPARPYKYEHDGPLRLNLIVRLHLPSPRDYHSCHLLILSCRSGPEAYRENYLCPDTTPGAGPPSQPHRFFPRRQKPALRPGHGGIPSSAVVAVETRKAHDRLSATQAESIWHTVASWSTDNRSAFLQRRLPVRPRHIR